MSSRPNIVWISIDSVRQDRTSLGDHDRDTTPHLSSIANKHDAQQFSNCIAHGFSTRTSTASILTARHPGDHGVSTLANTELPSSIPTFPELLSENGYRTVGISTNAHISHETNLDRGFDQFTWISPKNLHEIGASTLIKFALNIRRHSIGFDIEPAAHSSEFLVNDIAKREVGELESGGNEPFFMFAHYNGPHTPYYPPLPWLDRFLNDLDTTPKQARWLAKQAHYRKQPNKTSEIDTEIGEWDEERQQILRALYDAELCYTDHMVGRLINYIMDEVPGKTIVVITADHGELLGERGRFAHGGYPLEGLINVPLVIMGIDDLPGPDTPVQHADVTTTLGEISGIPIPDTDGIDLRNATREYAITQAFNPSIVSVRSNQFKYEDGLDGERLYELPDEVQDVKSEFPTVFDAHQEIGKQLNRTPGTTADLSADAEQQLENLGYKI
jgi:arylsulfatase A-like enzyme